MSFPQPILISFCIALPIYFMQKKKYDALTLWLALACTIDIFNSQKYMNLTALKLCGLTLAPWALFHLKELLKQKTVKFYLLMVFYLLVLGVIYGLIFPWQDPPGITRSGRDVPQWRAFIHLGSIVLESLPALFIGEKIAKGIVSVQSILKGIILGGTLSCFGAIIELIWQIDFYNYFVGSGKPFLLAGRAKGLNYEPRGLAQTCIYALIALFFHFKHNQNKKLLPLIPLFLISAFYLTFSLTATLSFFLAIGVILLLAIKNNPNAFLQRKSLVIIFTVLCCSVVGYKIVPTTLKNKVSKHLEERNFTFQNLSIINKLEIFDAAAVNYLLNHPKQLLIGTGPGLVSIPAYPYRMKKDWNARPNGFTALPHMGLVLLISNFGLIGLALWIGFILQCIKNISTRENSRETKDLFLVFIALYLFQIRYLYYIGLSLGTFNNKQKE